MSQALKKKTKATIHNVLENISRKMTEIYTVFFFKTIFILQKIE